jgi:ribosomal protein L19E
MYKYRQMEHIRGHVWHRYYVTANQAMVATVKLSKWWLQPNQLNFISPIVSKIKIKRIYTRTSIIYKYFHLQKEMDGADLLETPRLFSG